MMKYLFFLLALCSSILLKAQESSPVSWKFVVKPGTEKNQYILVATATVKEGWHVFAPDPGGDGLLIPTEVTITNKENLVIGPIIPQRRPITHEMKGIGMVNWYEGEIEFSISITSPKKVTLSGIASYQCCNENMCLPPTDVPFKISL